MAKSQFNRRLRKVGGKHGADLRRGRAVLQLIALGLVTGLAASGARPTYGTTDFWQAGSSSNGTWDNSSTSWGTSPSAPHTPNTIWNSPSTSSPGSALDAQFVGSGSGTSTVTMGANVVVNSITVGDTAAAGATYAFTGTSNTITFASGYTGAGPTAPNGTTGKLTFTTALNSATFQQAISTGTSAFVIAGSPATITQGGTGGSPAASGVGVTLGANTNTFGGGLTVTTGPIDLQITNTAAYETGTSSAYVTTAGTNGYNGTFNGVLLTSVSGTVAGSYPTITMDATYSGLTIASPKSGAQITHANDFILPNNLVMNPSGAANFVVGLGIGSTTDAGIASAGSTGQANTPAASAASPAPLFFGSMTVAGLISGTGDVVTTNDFWCGGGKGITIFANPNNNYVGRTVINNNGPTYQTFTIAAATAIPVTSDLTFGCGYINTLTGDTKIDNKDVGAFDLNGFDVKVHSLSTSLVNLHYVQGITATNNSIWDHNLLTGPNSTTTKVCTLTIDSGTDSSNATVNSTFAGNIWDGLSFMTAANADAGAYAGVNHYWTGAGNAGLAVGITLAATNKGSLTLWQVQAGAAAAPSTAGTTVIDSYSGATTVNGGTLYVNTTVSGSTVTVNTPAAGNTAALGGKGTISSTGGVHIATGATIAPGYINYAAPFNGSLHQTGVATAGKLTITNLTMDPGSHLSLLINDGTATTSSAWSYVNVTGTFTSGATAGSPVLVDPRGTFSGFNNASSATWSVATIPGLDITKFALDTAGDSILTAPILAGGTFGLQASGSTLNLVFTPSATAQNLLWAGASGSSWDTLTVDWQDRRNSNNPTNYSQNANVNFNNPASATIVNIQAGGVSPATVVFANTTNSYTLQGGSIGGTAPVSLTGTGTVVFTQANNYSGGTSVLAGGTVETPISGALGSGDITIYSGTWNVTTANQTYGNNLSVNGNPAASPATVSTVNTATNLILNGNVIGAGTLTKTGPGVLTVNGSLGQSGDLAVNQGSLVINGAATYGGMTTIAAGASITVNQSAQSIFSLRPTTGLAGDLIFPNAINLGLATGTFSGTGRIILNGDQSSVQGQGSAVTYSNGIVLNQGNLPGFGVWMGMASTVATISFSGPISGNGDIYLGAGVGGGGGATIHIGGANTYTGVTYLATGKTSFTWLDASNVLPSTTVLTFGLAHSGAGFLDLNATTQTIANLDCDPTGGGFGGLNSSIGPATLNLTGSVSGKFNALIEGRIELNVALTNTAVLSLQYNEFNGTDTNTYGNTYSGITTVTSGVLRLTDPLAFSQNTNIVLNGGVLENGGTFATFSETLGADSNSTTGGEGDGEIQVTGGISGFSAHTIPLTVNLVANGGGSTLIWGSTYFAPSTLVLNETTADTTLNFQNNLDLAGAARTVTVNTLGAATAATISGNITSIGGSLIKIGTGTLILSGANTYGGGTTVNGGVLQFASAAAIPSSGKVAINAGGAVAVTGAYTTVAGWLNSGVITTTSAGALALTADSNEAIDLTTAGGGAYTNISLGATGSVTFSGSITPLAQTYRLGGGGGTLTVSTALGDSGGTTGLAISGPGKVIFTNANTFTGNTSIAAGATLQLGDGSTASGSIGGNVAMGTGGTLAFANPTAQAFTGGISGAGSVTKTGAGALSLTGTAATLSYTGATVVNQGILTLNTAGFIPGSVLDINKGGSPKAGAIVMVKGGAANISALASAISTGYAGGAWNAASGISSTSASVNNNQGIGYLTGAQYNTLNPGNTLGLAAGDAILKYTWRGDINLDGTVDLRDLQLLDAAYVSGGVGMGAVDSNYDGVINAADFATAYTSLTNEGNTVLANQLYPVFASEFGGAFTGAVPEPASLGLLGLGGLLALRRRR